MSISDDYVRAVNAADEPALLALFAPGAELRNPRGIFTGHDEIAGFYRDVVFAGRARTEITRVIPGPAVEVAQLEATSPLGKPGNRTYAIDVFGLGPDGRITTLEIYYR
ncbi:nuclear transport factor 2 family protein [Nocardia sp. NPDC056611]|uniref:nuclear transport factor 2 family protein n=1 Tax=Nocardia sp. NPDC056611 TaxID=3345877 RepID=UPI003671CE39